MALDFNVLTQVPSFGERFMAGRQAAQEEQSRNMLLQQRQMEFQQSQDDRKRKLLQETQFQQLSDLVAQNGMDPDDPKILGQFAQAALKSGNAQLATLVDSMAERAAKRRLAAQEAADVKAAMAGPGALTGLPEAVTKTRAAAPAIEAPPAVAPQELSRLAVEQAGYARPRGYAQGQFVGGAPTAMTSPVGAYPAEPAPRNLLAPTAAAPVNAMAAPPAQVAAPPARPAAGAPDVSRMEEELERLQTRYDRVAALGTEAARKQAALLKPELDRLSRRVERASKAGAADPAELRTMDALGIPRTEAGFARFNKLKQRPEAMSTLSRLIAERDRLPATDLNRKLYDDAIKKATTQAEGTKVEVKLPEQEKAFETELGKGQAKKILEDKAVAEDARSIIDTVQQGRQLLQSGMITGFGAEALTQIGAALNQAGISFASDSVANTQAFAANMAQNVGRIIKQFGAGTGLSNEDREYAEKMAGGKITLDRAAIERILDINERAARNVITAHNKRVEGVKTNVPLTVEMPAAPAGSAQIPGAAPSAAPRAATPSRVLSPEDKQALEWANKNSSDPRAAQIKQRLGM